MIDLDDLHLVHYCHPSCTPFENIMRLPEQEAFRLAGRLAEENPGDTAFGRFADFQNYYPRRKETDRRLYEAFAKAGGAPEEEHPLSFVLHGSAYLESWFGHGPVKTLPVNMIASRHISFTYGDSGAVFEKTGKIQLLTREELAQALHSFPGTVDEYFKEIVQKCHYIEAQLWADSYIKS